MLLVQLADPPHRAVLCAPFRPAKPLSLLMAGPCLDFGRCMGSSTPPFIGSLSFVIPLLPQRWAAGGVVNSSLVGANGDYPQVRKCSKRFIDSKEDSRFRAELLFDYRALPR